MTAHPQTEKKFFTVAEANKTLPLVRLIVRDIMEKIRELGALHERLQIVGESSRDGMSQSHREEVEEIEGEFAEKDEECRALIKELHNLGAQFKGAEGLVDFAAMLHGREVLLCWKYDEPCLSFWHEIDAGFRGRQLLTVEVENAIEQGT